MGVRVLPAAPPPSPALEPDARGALRRRWRSLRLRATAPCTPLRGRPGLRRAHTPIGPGSTPGPATTSPVSRRSCRPCSAAGPGRHWDGAPRRGGPTEEARRSNRRSVEVRVLPSARAPVAQRTERSASTRGRRGFESSRGRHADRHGGVSSAEERASVEREGPVQVRYATPPLTTRVAVAQRTERWSAKPEVARLTRAGDTISGPVAQPGERPPRKREVGGAKPLGSTDGSCRRSSTDRATLSYGGGGGSTPLAGSISPRGCRPIRRTPPRQGGNQGANPCVSTTPP